MQVAALALLGPDNLTLSGGVLDQIATGSSEMPTPQSGPIDEVDIPGMRDASSAETLFTRRTVNLDTDYLADGAKALKGALADDAEATRKLADALKIFGEMEQRSKDLIQAQLHALQVQAQ